MARYQVILAYDGTQYHGFQRQSHVPDKPKATTVQSVVEDALRQLGWRDRAIQAAGRTDAGVHASGQVIAFDLDWKHSPEDLRAAINANLPPHVAVWFVQPVDEAFHPRYDAVTRCYRYRIFCQEVRDPLREYYAWRVWPAVELEPLQNVASHLIGTHDFAAYGSPPRVGGNTVRTVTKASWQRVAEHCAASHGNHSQLIFEIAANGFLNRMVRRLVWFQVMIGWGKLGEEMLARHLASPPDSVIQGLAPPQGLTLVSVEYSA